MEGMAGVREQSAAAAGTQAAHELEVAGGRASVESVAAADVRPLRVHATDAAVDEVRLTVCANSGHIDANIVCSRAQVGSADALQVVQPRRKRQRSGPDVADLWQRVPPWRRALAAAALEEEDEVMLWRTMATVMRQRVNHFAPGPWIDHAPAAQLYARNPEGWCGLLPPPVRGFTGGIGAVSRSVTAGADVA